LIVKPAMHLPTLPADRFFRRRRNERMIAPEGPAAGRHQPYEG
jgi:hypothetical protein